jgi:hypothetical protein
MDGPGGTEDEVSRTRVDLTSSFIRPDFLEIRYPL